MSDHAKSAVKLVAGPVAGGCFAWRVASSLLLLLLLPLLIIGQPVETPWREVLRQPPEWYGGAEATRIADNVLIYQRAIGGWPKNTEMARHLGPADRDEIIDQKEQNDATIDNGATTTQLIYLARVGRATGAARFRAGFTRGLDYLLKAQYENGGWPQYYPRLTGYYRHITYNDQAMIGVMELLREIGRGGEYDFVDAGRRRRAEEAVRRGIECLLRTQVKVNGRLTAWCAQHDEVTLAPAPARSYEKISLSGSESVGIVRFLMGIEKPAEQVVRSITAAVEWLDAVRLTGLRVVERPDPTLPKGADRIVVRDAQAGPLWARFYEIGSNRPIFSGRDGVVRYSLAEIEAERRNGYSWYVTAPATLLERDYPAWQRRIRLESRSHK